MKKKLFVLSGLAFGLVPVMALAQAIPASVKTCATVGGGLGTAGSSPSIGQIICEIGGYIQTLIPIAITLGVVLFIWGVAQYVIAADEEAKTKGRDKMIYGIIGLAIVVGLWGVIAILQRSFGLQNSQAPVNIPSIPQ